MQWRRGRAMSEFSENQQHPQHPRVTDPRLERQEAVPHDATQHDAELAEQTGQAGQAGHESAAEVIGVGGISQTWHVRVALLLVRIYAILEANTFVPTFLPQPLRRKRFGYLAAALAEVAITLITVETVRIFPSYSFVGLLNFMLVALIALSWGAVPALVATVSGAALLETVVFLPPFNQPLHPGGDFVETLTFLGAGLIVGIAASQTEGGRRRAVMRQLRAQAGEMGQREANRRMDEFLALVTHELKNPLSGMQLATQLARRNLAHVLEHETEMSSESVERLQRNLMLADQIQRQASVQNRLIGDLLDISRIQSDRLELHVASCDLVEIVRQAVEDQQLAWPKRQITLALDHCTPEGNAAHRGGRGAHRAGRRELPDQRAEIFHRGEVGCRERALRGQDRARRRARPRAGAARRRAEAHLGALLPGGRRQRAERRRRRPGNGAAHLQEPDRAPRRARRRRERHWPRLDLLLHPADRASMTRGYKGA